MDERFQNNNILNILVTIFLIFVMVFIYLKFLFF